MLFGKYITLAVAALASPVLSGPEYTYENGAADLQSLTSNLDSTRQTIAAYDGSIRSGVLTAKALRGCHQQAIETRKKIETLDPFPVESEAEALPIFKDLIRAMQGCVDEGSTKAPLFKEKRVGFVTKDKVASMYAEMGSFQDLLRKKMSDEFLDECEPSLSDLDKSFSELLEEF